MTCRLTLSDGAIEVVSGRTSAAPQVGIVEKLSRTTSSSPSITWTATSAPSISFPTISAQQLDRFDAEQRHKVGMILPVKINRFFSRDS